jgi:hypothetical protein
MLQADALKDLLSQKQLGNTDRLLICLAVDPTTAKSVAEIKKLSVSNGLRAAKNWNISAMLARVSEKAVRTSVGWELTATGAQHVARIAGPLMSSPVPKVASSLRAYLVQITNSDAQRFVEEAIICYEARQYRAATVLSWVGAIAVLYDHVVKNELAAFNAEAPNRMTASKHPWVPAKNADGLSRMGEADFLVTIEKISVIGKNVKLQLEKCWQLRNGCGHPNSLKIAEHSVASHIEVLMLNVFAAF